MVHSSYGPGYLWATNKSLWATTVMFQYTYGPHYQLVRGSDRISGRNLVRVGIGFGIGVGLGVRIGLGKGLHKGKGLG